MPEQFNPFGSVVIRTEVTTGGPIVFHTKRLTLCRIPCVYDERHDKYVSWKKYNAHFSNTYAYFEMQEPVII